jgi:hypothetical protein
MVKWDHDRLNSARDNSYVKAAYNRPDLARSNGREETRRLSNKIEADQARVKAWKEKAAEVAQKQQSGGTRTKPIAEAKK